MAQQPIPRIQPTPVECNTSENASYISDGASSLIVRRPDWPQRDLLPYLAFISFRDNYEEPQTSEGFAEVIKVNWVFDDDEDARQRWSMWLQIDGK